MELQDSVADLPFVGPAYEQRLKRLEIETLADLLLHVPRRYLDFRKFTQMKNLRVGDIVTVQGKVLDIKNQYTRSGRKIQVAEVSDQTGIIKSIWFNQPYLVHSLSSGTNVRLAGKIDWWGREPAFISPEFETKTQTHTGRLVPLYPETEGVSSKWLRARIKDAFQKLEKKSFQDYLPAKLLKEHQLISWKNALKYIHYPASIDQSNEGRERLAFDELLRLELANHKRKKNWQKKKSNFQLKIDAKTTTNFEKQLPFELTSAQKKAVKEILTDLEKGVPMNRLLEGDVGSGKTVVAALAIRAVLANQQQVLFMAPTQILAEQHFETLKKLFPKNIKIGLLTQAVKKRPKDWQVLIGTHALLHQKINEKIGLVIIDEQHRFGVRQRGKLVKKAQAPHVLTMTATPIPRTVAMTFYGDLDLSVLDELPGGRQKISTWIVPPEKRQQAYNWINKQLKTSQTRAYVVCPLIEESVKESLKQIRAATKEFSQLEKTFPEHKLGLMHGRLKPKEKSQVIADFKKGKIDILVTTPVVEVGIDVPEATIMVIEGADRFGLAQLHQLRGRVGRGKKKSYCLLFTESKSAKAEERLKALKSSKSGFELAELDLKMRGPGEIFGTRQSGLPELKIANWQDIHLIKVAKKVAQEYPQLAA